MAHPGGHRLHEKATPLVGGLAMFLASVVSLFLFVDLQSIQFVIFAMLVVVMTGMVDDKRQLPSWLRFLAQGIAAYVLIKYSGIQLLDLGNLFGSGLVQLNQWSVAITIFSVIGVINAINMSDGIDGLAGCMTLLVLLALLIMGISETQFTIIVIAAVCGFLLFNLRVGRPSAKVFMGDAGSLMLGLILAMLLIKSSQGTDRLFPPVTALWLLALPLFDAVALLILRPLRGKSPFDADRVHYHHMLADRGVSVNKTLIILLAIQALFIAAGLFFLKRQIPEHIQFYLFLILFGSYFVFLMRKTR